MLKETGTKPATQAEETGTPEPPTTTTGDPGIPTGPATVPAPKTDEGGSEEKTEDPASSVAPTNIAGARTVLETKVGAPLTLSNERKQLAGTLKGWTEVSRKARQAVRDLINAEGNVMSWAERSHLYRLSRTLAACEDIGDEGKLIAEGKIEALVEDPQD